MKNKTFISTLLLFVFLFMLVHNVIPHHHHDDISEINNHEHKHHHYKKEQDHHNENDEKIGLFSHPIHIFASTEFTFKLNNSNQKTQTVKQFVQFINLIVKSITISIKHEPPNYISVIPICAYYSTYSLRGPPTFSV